MFKTSGLQWSSIELWGITRWCQGPLSYFQSRWRPCSASPPCPSLHFKYNSLDKTFPILYFPTFKKCTCPGNGNICCQASRWQTAIQSQFNLNFNSTLTFDLPPAMCANISGRMFRSQLCESHNMLGGQFLRWCKLQKRITFSLSAHLSCCGGATLTAVWTVRSSAITLLFELSIIFF